MSGDAARDIIQQALSARSAKEATRVNALIAKSIGDSHERPLADRANNHGLMAGYAPSYDALLVELAINGVDSLLELRARLKYPDRDLEDMPWNSPREAALELFAGEDKSALGQLVTLHTYPANGKPRQTRLITPVVRDRGVGLTPRMIPETIFYLGSRHKDGVLWLHGAYGLGGAMTYRNARAVVVVTRRQPDLLAPGEEDRISVAVCEWRPSIKGEGLHYLVTADWGSDEHAPPWSAPAEVLPNFDPGLHIALIEFETKNFYSLKSDRRSPEIMIQTRLPDPVLPIGVHNHVAKGDHFKIPEGNIRVFANNPRDDRVEGDADMLVDVEGHPYKLPVRWYVFLKGATADVGGMRTFIWDRQAVVFTSNGQVHRHWTQQELHSKVPKLKEVWDRLHVIVDTDAIPIRDRTALFTPTRSTMRDTRVADKLQAALAALLQADEELREINGELIRERLKHKGSVRSTRKVAERIAKALRTKGFGEAFLSAKGDEVVVGPPKRPPTKLYPNPTTLEGPNEVLALPGTTKHLGYHLNATDDFMPHRGKLEVRTEPNVIGADRISGGTRLRGGRLRVQLSIPENMEPGTDFTLFAEVKDWLLASGGVAAGEALRWETKVSVVNSLRPPEPASPPKKKGDSKRVTAGSLLPVLWRPLDAFADRWDKTTPGHVEDVEAQALASAEEEYQDLKSLGAQQLKTIFLNEDYAPLKKYTRGRIFSRGASELAIALAYEKYAIGVGVALVDLDSQRLKAERDGKPFDDDLLQSCLHAAAQGVIAVLPEFDELIRSVGLQD